MGNRPSITEHVPFLPPLGVPLETPESQKAIVAAASSEAAQRDMAMMRDLNQGLSSPKPPPPQLRAPVLPDDFAAQVRELDQKIYARGVAVDSERLLSLGRERFQELLAAEREARTERVIGTRCDLTSFPSSYYAFALNGALQHIPVPTPTTAQEYQGAGQELDEMRQLEGFDDLWKLCGAEPRAVRAIYAFRNIVEALILGQSLFTCIEDDGRVHHKFFARGSSGNKVGYFEQWLSSLKGPHHKVTITNRLGALVFWLAWERSPLPDARDLAREWFGVRAPSPEQIKFAAALFDGWALNYKDWALWQFVGRQIRTLPDRALLERWSDELQKRFPRIDVFHRQVAGCFLKPVGDHHEFEPARHRRFIDATVLNLSNALSTVVGLTIEGATSGVLVARFDDWLLLEGKPPKFLQSRIESELATAFPSASFQIAVAERQS
jgi:hypothetical protein